MWFVWALLSQNFSLIWRRQYYRWKAANFDLCSAFMAFEQWGFFSLPHLLRQGASFYNGHLWAPVTLPPIAKCLAVELSLPIFTTYVCRGWDSNTQPLVCGAKYVLFFFFFIKMQRVTCIWKTYLNQCIIPNVRNLDWNFDWDRYTWKKKFYKWR